MKNQNRTLRRQESHLRKAPRATVFAHLIAACAACILPAGVALAQSFTWDRVAIGGGGANSGILIHPAVPNLIYARQDTAGVLRWDASTQKWKSVSDWMPLQWRGAKSADGIAVDPNPGADTTRRNTIYAAFGGNSNTIPGSPEGNGVFRSTNQGDTWVKIWNGVQKGSGADIHMSFAGNSFASNSESRFYGECLAVDPANHNYLYVGTRNDGLHRSTNAAAASPSFSKIIGAPDGYIASSYSSTGVRSILIDPSGGTVGSGATLRSRVVYIGVPVGPSGSNVTGGVYKSTDGGDNFTRLTGGSVPPDVRRMALGSSGSLLVVCSKDNNGIYKYNGSTWSQLPGTGSTWFTAIDTLPSNRDRIIASGNNGRTWRSTDGGANWSQPTASFTDVGWLTPGFQYPGGLDTKLDPHNASDAWFGDGFGIHRTDDVWAASNIAWEPKVKGEEVTVTWSLAAPPTGSTLLYSSMADVNGFKHTNLTEFPSTQLAQDVYGPTGDPTNGDSVISDIEVAPSDSTKHAIVRATLGNYYSPYPRLYVSSNTGTNWASKTLPGPEPGSPDAAASPGPAKIAISATDPNRIVFFGAYRYPYYTTNAFGAGTISWTKSTGLDFTFNDANPYNNRALLVEADAVDGMKFYIARSGNPSKVYVSTNGGTSWSLPTSQGLPETPWPDAGFIESTRNAAGQSEVWYSAGTNGLWRSTNGGTSFSRVNSSAIQYVQGFAFGKNASGDPDPTLFVAGKISIGGVLKQGIFISTDMGATFQQMTVEGLPLTGGTNISEMVGDTREFGRVYIGTGGTGILYSTVGGSQSQPGPNLVSNPSFDAENYDTQTPSGWSEWSSSGGVTSGYTETNGGGKTGARHATHHNSNNAYNMYTYQVKTGLANGLYTLRAWAKRGGSQTTCYLEAKDFGGSARTANVPVGTIFGAYSLVEIKDINVTNGHATIGLWTVSNGNSPDWTTWVYFDDVEFFKQ